MTVQLRLKQNKTIASLLLTQATIIFKDTHIHNHTHTHTHTHTHGQVPSSSMSDYIGLTWISQNNLPLLRLDD